MRSGSMRPEFSSTIFFCRWKNGTSVGHSQGPAPPVSMCRMISGASLRRNVGVHLMIGGHFAVHFHQRAGAAQAHAAHALHLHLVLHAGFGHFRLQRVAAPGRCRSKGSRPPCRRARGARISSARRVRPRRSCAAPQWSRRSLSRCAPASLRGRSCPATAPSTPPPAPARRSPGSARSARRVRLSAVVSPGLIAVSLLQGRQQRRPHL